MNIRWNRQNSKFRNLDRPWSIQLDKTVIAKKVGLFLLYWLLTFKLFINLALISVSDFVFQIKSKSADDLDLI